MVCECVGGGGGGGGGGPLLKLQLHSSLIFISSQDTMDAKRKHQSPHCPPRFLSSKLKWYLIAVQ